MDMELKRDLLALATQIAQRAGELLSQRPVAFDLNQKSSAVDFATQMDIASEKLIVDSILAKRPDDGIFGEEGSDRTGSTGITWVIDPLDGTVNYFYGMPGWNVSIAVKDGDGVQVGVVYAPTINGLWQGVRSGGSTYNGASIACNDPITLDRALIATGLSYDIAKRTEQAELLSRLIPRIRDIRRNGAAAVDLCMVAMGALDAYYELGTKEWDHAAGGLIAQEAGARVTGRHGGAPNEAMVVAAGPSLHAQLLVEID
jgi:myo-inositol-1(or 4)-monophosphatase